jgi:hypothetical protein
MVDEALGEIVDLARNKPKLRDKLNPPSHDIRRHLIDQFRMAGGDMLEDALHEPIFVVIAGGIPTFTVHLTLHETGLLHDRAFTLGERGPSIHSAVGATVQPGW